MVRLVTYNTQFCTGLDGRTDIDRIAAEISGADVIALQEIDRYWARTGHIDQAGELARRFPDYYWAYGPGLDVDASYRDDEDRIVNRRRQFGNMVLSRWPIALSRNHLLPKLDLRGPMSLQRAALETVILMPDGPCRVVSVHLAHAAASERLLQIDRLLSVLAAAPIDGGAWSGTDIPFGWDADGPPPPTTRRSAVMGDFNLKPHSTEYDRLCGPTDEIYGALSTRDGLVDAWTLPGRRAEEGPASFVGKFGPLRLDYVFVSDELAGSVADVWIDEAAQGSDHLPLWVELTSPDA